MSLCCVLRDNDRNWHVSCRIFPRSIKMVVSPLANLAGHSRDFDSGVIEVPAKLFIGRFPKSLDESGLVSYFEAFGKVKECVILRDFSTKQSKGCAFIKFGSVGDAVECIRKLNNQLVLDDAIGPLQVQFANGEIERLGLCSEQIEIPPVKIFVGSLPTDVGEQSLFDMFAPFGEVVETFILRHDESSKGSVCSICENIFECF